MMAGLPSAYHQPVMVRETLDGLLVRPGRRFIDCTLGDGGHAAAVLDASAPGGRLLGMDLDPEAVAFCRQRLAPYGSAAVIVQANFAELESVAAAHGFVPAQGVLLDLGVSSRELEAEGRGFSFQRAEAADMRFDPSRGLTAAALIDQSSEQELADLIYRLGQEPRSRRIARAIVASRPIATTQELAEVVRRASGYRGGRIHPATRTLMALRMAVNTETENLESVLGQVARVLEYGGRLVTIAYHTVEDKVIKTFLAKARQLSSDQMLQPVNRRVIRPSLEEIHRNRRSRSARMRVAERPQQLLAVA